MSYPAPLWSALEDVLRPQHIFAQNTEESVYIRLLNLDSATVPFFSLMLAFLPNFVSGWFLAFARQVRVSPATREEAKVWETAPRPFGQLLWDGPSPATASRSRPGSSTTITEERPQTGAQETTRLQRRLALTSGSPFLHLILEAVGQQRWQKKQKHL